MIFLFPWPPGGVLRWPRAQVHHPTADPGCQDTGAGSDFGLSSCLADGGGLVILRGKKHQGWPLTGKKWHQHFLHTSQKKMKTFFSSPFCRLYRWTIREPETQNFEWSFLWRLKKQLYVEARRGKGVTCLMCFGLSGQELPIRYAQRILQIEALPGWQASRELVEEGKGMFEHIGDLDSWMDENRKSPGIQSLESQFLRHQIDSRHLTRNIPRWWFQIFFIFIPTWGYLGKWSNLTNIFQRGWNHQLATQKSSNLGIPRKFKGSSPLLREF